MRRGGALHLNMNVTVPDLLKSKAGVKAAHRVPAQILQTDRQSHTICHTEAMGQYPAANPLVVPLGVQVEFTKADVGGAQMEGQGADIFLVAPDRVEWFCGVVAAMDVALHILIPSPMRGDMGGHRGALYLIGIAKVALAWAEAIKLEIREQAGQMHAPIIEAPATRTKGIADRPGV